MGHQANSAFYPSVALYKCNYMNYGGGDHQNTDQSCEWLFSCSSKSVVRALTAAYKLQVRSVCDTKAPLQLQYVVCGAT